jgi:LysR family glycine cleavage system transcriptional activator
VVPILQDFRCDNPEVEIDLVSPYGIGPPASDVDVAVLYSRPAVTDRVSDLLWPARLGILCHPELATRHAGMDLESFIRENELVHMRVEGLPRRHFWSQFARHHGLVGLDVERGLVFDTEILTVQYILSGSGIALVDLALFDDHVKAGRLACPYEARLDDGFGYYLVTDPEALSDTATALFRSWLIDQLGPRTVRAVAAGADRAPQSPGVATE